MMRAALIKVVGTLGLLCFGSFCAASDNANLFRNGDFEQRDGQGMPVAYQLGGGVEYRYLGDPKWESSSWGVALEAARYSGSVTQTVKELDAGSGRSFRFSFRGLPQDSFMVGDDDLFVKFEFFGGNKSYDAMTKKSIRRLSGLGATYQSTATVESAVPRLGEPIKSICACRSPRSISFE